MTKLCRLLGFLLCFALTSPVMAHGAILINGAGASFPFPLYSKWFSSYNKSHPNVKINYQSIGSGGGIRQVQNRTVDFGASDAPMTDEEMSRVPGKVLHIPTILGAVVVTYNLQGVTQPLKFTPDVLAGIFTGKITNWSDSKIAAENPGVSFPNQQIILVTRADGSGTTAVFTDYLGKVDPTFASTVGVGKIGRWPSGLSGKGNEGVTGLVKQNPGSIGYVELVYAETNKLPFALIKNAAGKFVRASVASVSAAAAGAAKKMPADLRVSITNAPGKNSYPISSFTYLLVYQNMDHTKGPEFIKFLNWAMSTGQRMAPPLFYAPLPKAVLVKVQQKIKLVTIR